VVNKGLKRADETFTHPLRSNREDVSSVTMMVCAEGTIGQNYGNAIAIVRFVVGAPAFMRGKERFSAPGKSLAFDHAL
jgi:hypothetical protein